jgi:hypothetical protein
MQNEPVRGQRVIFFGDKTTMHPAVVLRVRETGAVDLAVFKRDVVVRNSVLHTSKTSAPNSWDYAPDGYDWESRAA